MSKKTQFRRRVAKKSTNDFDKYSLYRKAVQSPDTDVEFLRGVYRELKSKDPQVFREDFCGTFALSCEWVKLNKKFQAYGVDLDPEPIEYGRLNNLTKLKPDAQKRVHIVEGNVLTSSLPKADVAGAMNFSYFVFRTRAEMKLYFANVFRSLNRDGIFVLDIFGGSLCYDSNEESTKLRDFVYYWDQENYDPVTNRATFHIHFKLKGRKKIEHVFTYDWRMWSIPELRELLDEVGFRKTHVYWEGTTRGGEGDGVFTRTQHGEACQSWIAYIVSEK